MAGESKYKPDLVLRRELGRKIREIRKVGGFTQEALGERAGLSYKFIGELERGQVNVSIDSLNRISRALDIDIGDLFRKGKPPGAVSTERGITSKLSPAELRTIKKALRLMTKVVSPRR